MRKISLLLVMSLAVILSACGGLTGNSKPQDTPTPQPAAGITAVNHIVIMLQENRSFDHYFGQLNNYRQSQGFSTDVDVTPPTASQLSFDGTTTFTPFHMVSQCTEDLSSYWNESHNARNHAQPTSDTATMDGFAHAAGGNSRASGGFDINGQRVMGYYDDTDLPYYYFMATQFAMSDHWFAPVMTNTPANRMYVLAGTSHGIINKTGNKIPIPTIFDELQAANVTWKNYVPNFPNGSSLKPFPTYAKYLNTNIVPMSQYFDDLKNNALPQVVFIDRDSKGDLDEHPGPGVNVRKGAAYVAGIINALMDSDSWKDSVFFFTFDESGGFYDHEPPVSFPSPDGIPPVLGANDVCTVNTGPACDFIYTGFRLPNFIVSPFAKAHYVDHTPLDTTAILKFIEERFGLDPLSARDAAQPDISKLFFDFTNAPNATPPKPPNQPTTGPCYINSLP
jgi:phospholipase C